MKLITDYGNGAAWVRGPLLGKGTFGRVYKATNRRRPNHNSFPPEMAVKSAELSVSGTLQKEKEIMKALQGSPHLIRCFGVETTLGRNTDLLYYNLLLEYGSGGSLADRIKKCYSDGGLPEREVKAHAASLLRGLKHVHGAGYVHCDLKPNNVLLVPNNTTTTSSTVAAHEFTAKIGDFGLAKKAGSVPYPRGTAMYLSPEAVTHGVQEAPADIWALGCVVLEMLTGRRTWEGKNAEEILASIKAEDGMPTIDEVETEEARDFLKCCFVRKSTARFTAEMLLSHPFVNVSSGDDDDDDDDNCDAGGGLLEEEPNDQSAGVESDDDGGFSCSHLLLDDSFSSSSSDEIADIFHRPNLSCWSLKEANMY